MNKQKLRTPTKPLNILMAGRPQTRSYVEDAQLLVDIKNLCRGIQWCAGASYPFMLPGNIPALISCRDTGPVLIIQDREWQLYFELMPMRPEHKRRYIRSYLIDQFGKKVKYLYRVNSQVGSRFELGLHHRAEGQSAKKRERWVREKILQPIPFSRHAAILDKDKEPKSLISLRPSGTKQRMKRTTFLKIVAKARHGSVKRGGKQDLESDITETLMQYLAFADSHRRRRHCPPWLMSFQIQRRDDGLPILGHHTN